MNNTKKIVFELNSQGKSKVEISNILGISHQRVCQIINNYTTIRNSKKGIGKCSSCKIESKLQTHHIDNNCHNNDINNLVSLCEKCHKKLHRKIIKCQRCLEDFIRYKNGQKECFKCIVKSKEERRNRWAVKYTFCVICKKNDSKHTGHGICLKCQSKIRYKEDYLYRDRCKASAYKFKNNNPEKCKEINKKAAKKYLQKNMLVPKNT